MNMQSEPEHSGAHSALGAELRAARERRGLSLHQASQELHIGDSILDALERGDYTSLGAPIFVRGHLRAYARLLGLGEDQVLARYEEQGDKPAPPPLVIQKTEAGIPRVSTWVFSVLVIVVLCVLAIAWWTHRTETAPATSPDTSTGTNGSKPLVIVPSVPAPSTTAGAQDSASLDVSGNVNKPVPDRSESDHKPAAVPPAHSNKQGAQSTAHSPAAHLQVAHSSDVVAQNADATVGAASTQVAFTLNQASWIEVYDVNGKRLYYDLAPAGEHVNVTGAGPLQVFLGNAPGVSIELNGTKFDQTPYTRADNTARFRLGGSKDATGQSN